MEELDNTVSHFAEHVRACIDQLGSDGFEARFKNSDTNNSTLELINMFIEEYNLRLAGNAVDVDGRDEGPDPVSTRVGLPQKPLLPLAKLAGGPSLVRKPKTIEPANEGGSKVSGEDVEMPVESGPAA